MKKTVSLLLACTVTALCLAACMPSSPATGPATMQPTPAPSQDSTAPSGDLESAGSAKTGAAGVLKKVWGSYGEDERFSVYGGGLEHAVSDGPGDLDLTETEELSSRYFLTQDLMGKLEEAASMVHLMNNNIFTSYAMKLKSGTSPQEFARDLRSSIQSNQWICGQPDKLLMVQAEGSILVVAFGSADLMDTFKAKLSAAYSGATILYDEAIVA